MDEPTTYHPGGGFGLGVFIIVAGFVLLVAIAVIIEDFLHMQIEK